METVLCLTVLMCSLQKMHPFRKRWRKRLFSSCHFKVTVLMIVILLAVYFSPANMLTLVSYCKSLFWNCCLEKSDRCHSSGMEVMTGCVIWWIKCTTNIWGTPFHNWRTTGLVMEGGNKNASCLCYPGFRVWCRTGPTENILVLMFWLLVTLNGPVPTQH